MWNAIKKLWTKENRWALFLSLVLILLVILSTTDAPLWIYQNF